MAEARNPDHFAVAIGISRYPQFRHLKGAARDAERFLLWLQRDDGGGLPVKNIWPVLSPPEPSQVDAYVGPPSEGEIKKALQKIQVQWALDNPGMRIGARLYFYFSGHGFGPTADDICLLLPVSDAKGLQPSLSLQLYRNFFQLGMFFDEAIYIIDCCRDFKPGIIGNGPPLGKPSNPREFKQTKEFVVMAAAWGKEAFETTPNDDNDRRGILTSALLDGLEGAVGAVDFRGRITTASLKAYLDQEVPRRAQDARQKQMPEYGPTPEFVLAVVPRAKLPRTQVQIVAGPGVTGTLRLLGPDWSEIATCAALNAAATAPTWKVDLVRGFRYPVELAGSGTSMNIDLVRETAATKVFNFSLAAGGGIQQPRA